MGSEERFRFAELLASEETAFGDSEEVDQAARVISGIAADEPWVAFTPRDRFGLALSGGGIRSATFNLGVLQALAAKGVLKEVHYLSTVSGGGYIGGFWTGLRAKWLEDALAAEALVNTKGANATNDERQRATLAREAANRNHENALKVLAYGAPAKTAAGKTDAEKADAEKADAQSEPNEVRHVRQFGRFLIPRVGFSRSETWTAVLALLLGMITTLAMMLSLLGLAAVTFVALNFTLRTHAGFSGVALLILAGVSVLFAQIASEHFWLKSQKRDSDLIKPVLLGAVAVGIAALFVWWRYGFSAPSFALDDARKYVLPEAIFELHWELFEPALALASPAAALALVRILTSRAPKTPWVAHAQDALDRLLSRSLAVAILWVAACAVWEAARFVLTKRFTIELGGTGVVTGGVFLWLREWLLKRPTEVSSGLVPSWLKPLLPRLAATAAATALVVGAVVALQASLITVSDCSARDMECGLSVHRDAGLEHLCAVLFGGLGLLALVGLLGDPSELGLHGLYRSRIARTFLGARRPQRPFPRTQRQDDDDLKLASLKDLKAPVHLVCCAANHVQGDTLQTLGRGARSVVLSPHGVSLGSFARKPGDLTLAQALTASGAAFNSQMGGLSLQFGRSVSFLMSAFNLRLGLWVEHPRGAALNWLQRVLTPVRRFLSEAAGMTRAELAVDAEEPKQLEDRNAVAMHLSDGGHFDNLGLYELVRRHCRFIIVSDATADGDVAFDDFSNAIRRVREDFGVEIEIDVGPLRPVEGISRQHAVVGTIRYDRAGKDTGTLLYLKPSFVGEEPADVLQYRTRNAGFPHQGTGDQFYDDVQWESYRRLGEHIASIATPKEDSWQTKPHRVDALFLLLRQRWHAFLEDQTETFLEFTNRCSALETAVRAAGPDWFAAELFPELGVVLPTKPTRPVTTKELTDVLGWVMQVAQLMEDVWLASKLDDFASHPLNEGWMSYFHRWTAAPSFRRWWPILRPIYSDGFRNFMKRAFDLNLNDPEAEGRADENRRGAFVKLVTTAAEWPSEAAQSMGLPAAFGTHSLGYVLELEAPKDDARFAGLPPIPVGHLRFTQKNDVVEWNAEALQVPEWLVGGGIVARFLDRIVAYFDALPSATNRPRRLVVRVNKARNAKEERVTFYKSRGFTFTNHTMEELVRPVAKPKP